jgi:hypothetical protein
MGAFLVELLCHGIDVRAELAFVCILAVSIAASRRHAILRKPARR